MISFDVRADRKGDNLIIASCLDIRLIHILITLLAATRSMMEKKSRARDERMEQIVPKRFKF